MFVDPYFYLFIRLFSAFFLFMARSKQNKIKLCYNRFQFVKKTQTLYKTQNEEPNYLDHKFFFNFCQELSTCTKPWGQTSKYYRAGWLVDACIV